MSLFSLFLFEKFLLLKLATPYKEGPVLSQSPPLQLAPGQSGSGPVTAQLLTLPSQRPQSPWVLTAPVCLPLHPYSPPCDFKQPGVSRCCSNLVWQGRKPLNWISLKSPAADLAGTGPGPHTGPRDLIVLKHSPYCLIFQCPLQFLVSYIHICWGTVGCSLCSSVDWLGVLPVCRGKWNPLPPISSPS